MLAVHFNSVKKRDIAFQVAFGQHLRHLREERVWSQRQLAAISGIDETQISRVENGTQSANLQTILALSQALGRYPKQLFEFEFDYQLNEDFNKYHQMEPTIPTTSIVTRLAQTSFFDTPRSVADVIAHCARNKGPVLRSPATSAVLRKLVDTKVLKRIPGEQKGRYLYQKRK